MKKSNKILTILATFFVSLSFILSPMNAVFADEKPKEASSDTDKAKNDDTTKDKKKKEKKGEEEPDCE